MNYSPKERKMNLADRVPDDSGFQTIDNEANNIYLQESYCCFDNDISTPAEEIFRQISQDKQNMSPASYIP
jgi:hypothetical protein